MMYKGFVERLDWIIKNRYNGVKRRYAIACGLRDSTLQSYIEDGSLPGLENLIKLAKAGEVTIEWLVTGEDKVKKEIVAEESEQYYSQEEKEYIEKLIQLMRTKQDKTVIAIKQNIDAFLDNPNKEAIKKTKLAG